MWRAEVALFDSYCMFCADTGCDNRLEGRDGRALGEIF